MAEVSAFIVMMFSAAVSSILSSSDKKTKLIVFVITCVIAYFLAPYIVSISGSITEYLLTWT